MSIGHFYEAGGYVDHGDAKILLPVDELQATVHTHRDAEIALKNVPAKAVLAVRPTGMASSYALTQRPLAAIEINSLPEEPRAQLDHLIKDDLRQFELVQIGRQPHTSQNRSLAEF
ncbi:hypothetical protein [Halovenus halobia]|uniref:hypothetical protein n=1 Tax=Halovenus halobia TaxID=3396622 RepID=UPI003F578090